MRLILILCLLPFFAKAESIPPSFARTESIRFPGPDGMVLNGTLVLPKGKAKAPAIVALHGCGGPMPARDDDWAKRLAAMGHIVLLPDSYGSRGLGSQCGNASRHVTASGKRREDALAAIRYLTARAGTPPGGVLLMGWSDGGTTVLSAGRESPELPEGSLRGMIAFYPGCTAAERKSWIPAAPVLILMGDADDWTPPGPCHAVAERLPAKVKLVTYPGAYHDFDVPDRPVRIMSGLASPPSGHAHAGSNPMAREEALRQVPAFIAALP
jgi:dienelactone hydrolase